MSLIRPSILYKRFNSCLELENNLYVPSIQRDIIESHVKEMREHLKEYISKGKEPIFSSVDLAFLEGKYYVCDGQHRITAIQREYEENKTLIPIHALIYNVQNEDELEEVFTIKNKNIPVPSFLLSIKEKKKDILKKICVFLEQEHKNIFRYDKYTRPYININTFIENFRITKLFSMIETYEQFIQVFHMLNQECYTKICTMNEKTKRKYGISDRMLLFWTENQIYVGYSKDFDYFDSLELTGYIQLIKKE